MRAEEKGWGRRIAIAREAGNQIYKVNFTSWRIVGECLACYLPARMPQFVLDNSPGFLNCVRASGMRPKINEPLNMSQSFLSQNSSQIFVSPACD